VVDYEAQGLRAATVCTPNGLLPRINARRFTVAHLAAGRDLRAACRDERITLAEGRAALAWAARLPVTTDRAWERQRVAGLRQHGMLQEAIAIGHRWLDSERERAGAVGAAEIASTAAELAQALLDRGCRQAAATLLEPLLAQQGLANLPVEAGIELRRLRLRAWIELRHRSWRHEAEVLLGLAQAGAPAQVEAIALLLARGLLRSGQLREAGDVLAALPSQSAPWDAAFLRADLARLRGQQWSDAELDAVTPAGAAELQAWGRYAQAVARQPRDDWRPRLLAALAALEEAASLRGAGHVVWLQAAAVAAVAQLRSGHDPEIVGAEFERVAARSEFSVWRQQIGWPADRDGDPRLRARRIEIQFMEDIPW